MGLQATPVGNGGVDGQRLLHLADIDEIGKAIWKPEIQELLAN